MKAILVSKRSKVVVNPSNETAEMVFRVSRQNRPQDASDRNHQTFFHYTYSVRMINNPAVNLDEFLWSMGCLKRNQNKFDF